VLYIIRLLGPKNQNCVLYILKRTILVLVILAFKHDAGFPTSQRSLSNTHFPFHHIGEVKQYYVYLKFHSINKILLFCLHLINHNFLCMFVCWQNNK
jgi:hypothetical protein